MKYQKNYASTRPKMYEEKSRIDKAIKAEKVLKDSFIQLKNLTVLDIGSSTGIITNYFSKKVKKIVGIDIDQKAINFATKNNKNKNASYKVNDAMKLPFKNNTFDLVLCMHVYEHVPDSQKLFNEIYRVLKKNGVCYLAAQNAAWPIEPHYNLPFLSYLPKNFADFYIKIFTNKKEYYEHPVHYWKLKKMLNKFTIIEYNNKIFKNPQKYGYTKKLKKFNKASLIIKYFSPTFIWILKK